MSPTKERKPCRLKACGGVIHDGPCPIMSAQGRKGGKAGSGASKARTALQNGRFTTGKTAGKRSCCDTLKSKPHEPTCKNARITMRKESLQMMRNIRVESNINARPEISWRQFTVPIGIVRNYVRGVDGICGGCDLQMKAENARHVHRDDLQNNPVRVICEACE